MAVTTQPYALAREEGEALWFLGVPTRVIAPAELTGGAFGLIEHVIPPGSESPLARTSRRGRVLLRRGTDDLPVWRAEGACGNGDLLLRAAWDPAGLSGRGRPAGQSASAVHPRRVRALRHGDERAGTAERATRHGEIDLGGGEVRQRDPGPATGPLGPRRRDERRVGTAKGQDVSTCPFLTSSDFRRSVPHTRVNRYDDRRVLRERSVHDRQPRQPGHQPTPTPDLRGASRFGVASRQKGTP